MFYANLRSTNDKVSCYVIHKHIIIDFEMLTKEYKMYASPPKLTIGSILNYKKELAFDMLFPY